MRYKKNCPKCGFIHSLKGVCGPDIREEEKKFCPECGKEYIIIYVNGKIIAFGSSCIHRKPEYGKSLNQQNCKD